MPRKVWKRTKGANLNEKIKGDPTVATDHAECYFRNLEDHLVDFIEKSDSIVICMAWLTNQKVMKALTNKTCVLILQNESWLNKKGGLAKKTREMYASIRASKKSIVVGSKTIKEDLLVCGMISHPQNMHHKFAVRITDGKPTSVWTGSFNPTTNGNQSIENALVIHNEQIASAYFQEFLNVKAISKPLKI